MKKGNYLFTSESVTEGHPDKICDQISDAVLDDILEHDPRGKCCCETFTTTGMVLVGGEITTSHYVDIPKIVRGTIKEIVSDAEMVEDLGVDGIDLLAYRYDADSEQLIKSVQKAVDIPLIIAGSINSLKQVRKMAELNVMAFTIGSAIFDKKIVPKGTLSDQITAVLREIEKR